jgi:hypothetical protein
VKEKTKNEKRVEAHPTSFRLSFIHFFLFSVGDRGEEVVEG